MMHENGNFLSLNFRDGVQLSPEFAKLSMKKSAR